jgi:hypothetical protein
LRNRITSIIGLKLCPVLTVVLRSELLTHVIRHPLEIRKCNKDISSILHNTGTIWWYTLTNIYEGHTI